MRRRYLITYDVSDDKRRTALFHRLCDAGDHAQFSVFFAELSAAELASLRAEASALLNHERDQMLIVDLGRAEGSGSYNPLAESVEAIGKRLEVGVRVRVV